MINRKKRIGVIAAAAVAALVVTFPSTALAETFNFSETGTVSENSTNPNLYDGNIDGGATEIGIATTSTNEVKAVINPGFEIIYNVTVEFGAMEFEYDYGSTWNPTTHQYGTGSGQQTGWVVTNRVEGVNAPGAIVNNGIRITNDSNFPVKAEFSYDDSGTPLNADKTASGSVVGIFADNNTTLAGLLDKGYGVVSTTYTNPDPVTLEMDHSRLGIGEFFYYKDSFNGASIADKYFALSGKPDQNGPNTLTAVGAITVTIKPETGVTKYTI